MPRRASRIQAKMQVYLPTDPPCPLSIPLARFPFHSPSKFRPAQVNQRFAEKSVQIMHASSGGAIKGQNVVNRWGKVETPPEEWLYEGGRGRGGVRNVGGSSNQPALPAQEAGAYSSSSAAAAAGAAGGGSNAVGGSVGSLSALGGVAVGAVHARGTVGPTRRRPVPLATTTEQGGASGSRSGPKPMTSGFRPVYD